MLPAATVLLSVCTLILAYVALDQHRQLREGRGGESALRAPVKAGRGIQMDDRLTSDNTVVTAEERRAYEDEIQWLRSELQTARAELPGSMEEHPSDTEGTAEATFSGMLADYAATMKDPGVRALRRTEKEAQIEETYRTLFEVLALTAGEMTGFKELLIDEAMAREDIRLETGTATSASARAAEADRIDALTETYTERIRTFLGESNYESYEEWGETLHDRDQVEYYKQFLDGDDQISREQEDWLIAAMYEERADFALTNGSGRTDPYAPSGGTATTEEDIMTEVAELAQLHEYYIARARDILSAPQVAVFEDMLAEQRTMVEKTSRMMMLVGAAHEGVGGVERE